MTRRNLLAGALVAVSSIALLGYLAYQGLVRVEKGEHVTTLSWLPKEATDICFYDSYFRTAAEFKIGEQDFRRWCDSRGYALHVIGPQPFIITRYSLAEAWELSGQTGKKSQEESYEQRARIQDMMSRRVSRGLCYKKERDNGGGIWVAFDADNQMGYFYSTPR